VDRMRNFFSSLGGPQNVREGYAVDGTPMYGSDHRCFLAMASTLFVHSNDSEERQQWWQALAGASAPTDYFCAALRMMALLFNSGIMTAAFTPPPPPAPPPSPSKFACDSTSQQCLQDSAGTYTSKSACEDECLPPSPPSPSGGFRCSKSQQRCVADEQGIYPNRTACELECSPNYVCKSNQCVQDPHGTYPTYKTCYDSCHTGTCSNKPWAQCGGATWSGATCCPPGYSCFKQNEFFSQCCPGGKCHSAAAPAWLARARSSALA